MKKLLVLFLIEILGAPSFAQSLTEQIDKIMKAFHEVGQFNGTVLVAEHGKVIYENGFGNANMEWNIPNTPDTKFMLGSLSKQLTAMLVLQLVNKGLIGLNKTISDYLPYYPESSGKKITVRQLLNHTSGIPDIMNFPDFDEEYATKHFTTKKLLGNFATLPLDFEPGAQFNYSNSGYNVLAAIIEEVTGKTYGTVLKEFITEPLDMKNTGYAPSSSVVSNLANAYLWAPLDGYIHPAYFDNSISKGSGGIYSTVEDLFKWDQALYTNTLVPETLRNKMMEPNKNGYGFGFWISQWENPTTKKPLTFIEHGGANAGFVTEILRSVDDKNTIILLSNTNEAKLNFIKYRIRSVLYERPYDLPEKSVKNIVAEVLKEEGIEAAKSKYLELKKEQLDLYGEREFIYEFSQLGYSLFLSGHMAEAIEIYKMNAESFPNSAKVFDDLGEAYMFNGNKELAIKYYSKSLELDNSNLRIKSMLTKLKNMN